ncbi:MAG: glutamine-hydrolyzing carbamoyl-phosphate synthase small subunit [Bacteroidetes bacterium]|nr:glutamine-hydrolyzing carbamoyl-phosphate synthase small subunit [Bacteroidota bacterium]
MKFQSRSKALVLLSDGTVFHGKAVGVHGTAFGELCFNTGMTGYQEIFTDPSYFGQLMVTTNAHIGNYGVKSEESESDTIKISGLICRNFSYVASRVAADDTLASFLEQHKLIAVSDVDTRQLVTHLREHGAMNGLITTEIDKLDTLKEQLQAMPSMKGLELASKVSTSEPYFFGNPESAIRIAALDLGIKKNILRNFANRGAYVKVYPYDTSFEEMESWNPHGYFLSNGPGDPEPLKDPIANTQKILLSGKPLFGICLGHQILALANGIPTFKMHHGHRGINHPVLNMETGKGEITSQNHGFAISRAEVEAHQEVQLTHYHLNDQTVMGIKLKGKPVFSVQYHPEASPGPHDSAYLFDQFMQHIHQTVEI